MAHAAEVALAFFAGVGCEKDGGLRSDFGELERAGKGEERGEAGAVIAGAGGENAGAVFDWADVCGGEDGVEVGGEEDDVGWVGAGEFCQGVSGFIELGIAEAEVLETLKEPLGAGGLVEGGGGDG